MIVQTTGLLAGLMSGAAEDAASRRRVRPTGVVEAAALAAPPALDALAALRPREHVHVLAEVKRASPSRGEMAEIPDPAALAARYAANGASAISVLTEQRRFRGSLADLTAVRAAVRVPVLRKDFVSSEYQVLEARAAGADLVLLIVAALDDPALARLHALVGELGMTALVETHDEDEARRAADLGARLVGVNARDLDTFELDRTRFARLVPLLPGDAIRVAESAVRTPADVVAYRADGADVVLVGEALVTGDAAGLLTAMLAAA